MSGIKIIIQVSQQEAHLIEGSTIIKTYTVSTAANGLGCEMNSYCTPQGLHRVAQKLGDRAPIGTVFRNRVATGEVWPPPIDSSLHHSDDLILTRILWLEGLEPHNTNTFDRYIYLHGTNHEADLGKPVSHGCIRFSNSDILEVYERVQVGTLVEVIS